MTGKPHSEREPVITLRSAAEHLSSRLTLEPNPVELENAADLLLDLVEQLEATEQRLAREISEHACIEELYRDLLERAIKVATWYGHDLEAAVGGHLDNAGVYPPPIWDSAEFKRNASAIKAADASIYPKGGNRGD